MNNLADTNLPADADADTLLSRHLRSIIAARNLTPESLSALVSEYINDPANGVGQDRASQTAARGNILSQISSSSLSWSVFCKMLKLLKVAHVSLATRLDVNHSAGSVEVSTGSPFR